MTRMLDGCLILNKLGEEDSEIVSESDGNTAMLTVKVRAFLSGFHLPHSNFAPLNPNIAWARGSDSLRITWYKKG